jgi:hypothetical protein
MFCSYPTHSAGVPSPEEVLKGASSGPAPAGNGYRRLCLAKGENLFWAFRFVLNKGPVHP